MAKKSKKNTAVIIIFVCIAVVFGAKAYFGSSANGLNSGAQTKVKGSSDAPLNIIEFIDFQCPACAKGAQYLKEEMERYPQLIRLELKHFPLQMHKHGYLSAQYAECATEQRKFWEMHDLLLARQNNWKRLDDPRPAYSQMATEARIDGEELKACVASGRPNKVIDRNKVEGSGRSLRSTPTYFVNGAMVVGQKSLELKINEYLESHSE